MEALNLDYYTADLSMEVSPLYGRDKEIDRLIEVLSRKSKNHPLLIGDAGVGKTSIIKGLGYRIKTGDVPQRLQGKKLLSLDISLLSSDLNNISSVLSTLITSGAIVFIDEIHNIVGAGQSHGSLDLSNILKPLLTDGSLTCIGATTHEEYLKYIAKDAALDRRFTRIDIVAPTPDLTFEMIKNIRGSFESHHNIRVSDEAIRASIDLSVKYLKDRQLPDKAIDLLDESCSKLSVLNERVKFLEKRIEDAKSRGDYETASRLLYGELPKDVSDTLTYDDIALVLSQRTGIPLSKMTSDERKRLLDLEDYLRERVVGQDKVLSLIGDSIRATRAGLKQSLSSFIFLGSSGVGKTETAKALAEFLFDSSDSFIRFNMSEFQEKHSVSNLIGSPSGYVGYEEGGRLTNAVKRSPHCVILLDEIEKAHDDIYDILLQVFDEGTLTDNQGVTVDLSNAIVILTSNLSEGELRERYRDELIGRVDTIVTFNTLDKKLIRQIARKKLDTLAEKVKAGNNFTFVVEDCLFNHIVDMSYNTRYGAREIDILIDKFVIKPLSKIILEKSYREGTVLILKRS